jgi:uncharacterized protein
LLLRGLRNPGSYKRKGTEIDTLLIILGSLCILTGLVGSIVPLLPGPPISYLGLIFLHLTSGHSFSLRFLVIYAILTVIIVIMDALIPVYGTKWLKGSKYGLRGSALGMLMGIFFFPPVGIIIGPLAGAFLGEFFSGKKAMRAFRSAAGSFLGFLAGTIAKVILCLVMTFHFIKALITFL